MKIPALLSASLLLVAACGNKDKEHGAGLVAADAGPAQAVADAAPATVDISQCAGCQLAPTQSWTFEGIYGDASCTEPLAQTVTPACAPVPATGAASLTYVDDVGLRKAGEVANVTLGELVAVANPRFRKAGTKCVKANEAGTAITPPGCAGNRICRDASGGVVCASCRTFATGCPDVLETRTYATITDPGLKTKTGPAGGGNLNTARLSQCCNALATQAKAMGASPEGGMLASAAAQCLAIVASAANGNAPELGAFKALLAGRNVPPICSGF